MSRDVALTLGVDRARLSAIFAIALPIIGGMASQTVLNVVDTLMVSRLGAVAVAAVGLGGVANFLACAFITGLSAGVQAMAARRKGEGRDDVAAVPLNGGLIMVAALAIPLSVVLILTVADLYHLLSDDPDVMSAGIPYLQARLAGMVAVGANFAFRGYWNGVGLSRYYLRTLLFMHIANVIISYVLIFGSFGLPALGATGAGLGTMIATFLGTGYYITLGLRHARRAGFLRGIPGSVTMRTIIRLSVPSGVQQFLFALGMTSLFAIVALVGTAELAAASVLLNVSLVAILPGLGLGLAAASLVGQALGKGDADDAARWGWEVVKVAALALFVLGLPMLIVPQLIVGVFFDIASPPAQVALWPLRVAGATMAFEAVGLVLLNAIMGAGATQLSMGISVILQWGLFIPAAYLVGPVLGGGLVGIWITNAVYRVLQAGVCAAVWRRRRWAGVRA